jgi:hypothetical protein
MAKVKQFAGQILSLFLLSVFIWNSYAYALPTNGAESKGRPSTVAGQLIYLALQKAEQLKTVPVAGADVNQTQKQERVRVPGEMALGTIALGHRVDFMRINRTHWLFQLPERESNEIFL